ncbi:hypothetical protein RHSIM_RhsimUnG0031500 [Rhododendron simsii]|uniref:Uncharacterized protein n=1 Tax=Rhododendron simsii TaxID=118357 RepID=A0A834FXK3_RHOSS|nr:hypothetical protein RHSIM_RhsimUnG0031500 [Rhododendron simsii]
MKHYVLGWTRPKKRLTRLESSPVQSRMSKKSEMEASGAGGKTELEILKEEMAEQQEREVNFLEDIEYEWVSNWGVLAEEWLEREAIELHAQNQPEPGNEIMGALEISDEWLMAYVGHMDHDNQEEWEWVPTPNEWQMLEEADPLDCVTLPLLFTNYENELAHDQANQRSFGQPPENLEDFFGNVQFWDVEPTEYQLIRKDDALDTFSLSHLFGHETRLSLNKINRQHQAMNVFGKEYNSDPSKFIVPDTEPKPVVYVPEVPGVLFLGSFEMENRRLMEAWAERETMGGELTVKPEPVEEERMDEELHNFVPPMTFNESSHGHFEDAHHTGHEECAAFDTNQFIQVPEGYEQKDGMEDLCPLDGVTLPLLWKADPSQLAVETVFEDDDWFPQAYIIGESFPRPATPFPPQPDVSMLEHTPFDNFWDEDEVMDIQVGNGEVWTVNKAMIDDSFWMDSAIDGLSKRVEAVDINKRKAKESLEDICMEDPDMKQKMEEIKKGKRKVGEDIWGNNQGLWDETEKKHPRISLLS